MKYYVIKQISDGLYLRLFNRNVWNPDITEALPFASIEDIHALIAVDKKRNVAHRYLNSQIHNLSIIEVTLFEKHICDL